MSPAVESVVHVDVYWADGRCEELTFEQWPTREQLPADAVRFDIALPDLDANACRSVDGLLQLVNRYTEACDDLGCDLFAQGPEKHRKLHARAQALWAAIASEVKRLHEAVAKGERRAVMFGDGLHMQVVAMRAAVVAGHLESPAAGMQWIVNTLAGPGHLPNVDQARELGGAQALFDKEQAEHEAFRAAHPVAAAEGRLMAKAVP